MNMNKANVDTMEAVDASLPVQIVGVNSLLAALGVDETRANDLLILDVRMTDMRAQLQELRLEFIAKLPIATDKQMDAMLATIRKEEAHAEGNRPNVDFRLNAVQQEHVKTARSERQSFCESNAAALLTPLLSDATQKLRSFKVRTGATKITTVATWEKATLAKTESKSLIAQLARATAPQA